MQGSTPRSRRRFPNPPVASVLLVLLFPLAVVWVAFGGEGGLPSAQPSTSIPPHSTSTSSTPPAYTTASPEVPSPSFIPEGWDSGGTVQAPPPSSSLPFDGSEPKEPIIDESLYVGLTVEDATDLALASGFSVRVVSVDGESFQVTADYRTDRLNLTVVGGKVSAVQIG